MAPSGTIQLRRSRRPIVIAARPSPLARAQAQAVGAALSRLHPRVPVEYLWVESEGDAPRLSSGAAGVKGVFTRAVDQAVLAGYADLAVHSLKDVPASGSVVGRAGQLKIVAIPQRGDPRDCLISRAADRIGALPAGATVGTSSPRRAAQLRRLRPDLSVVALRGNVGTRVKKVLDDQQFDAAILAAAGLQRAGLNGHARYPIEPGEVLPAAGQAALALQCRSDDHLTTTRCLPLNDAASAAAVNAERQVVAALEGDCDSPIAVYAWLADAGAGSVLHLHARVLSPDGSRIAEVKESGAPRHSKQVVRRTLDRLYDAGAREILRGSGPAAR